MARRAYVLGGAIFLIAGIASSTTRIQQIAPNRFLVTHQKQSALGGQGKALRKSYEKAASLCTAAGYKWFEIVETQSKGRGWASRAGATLDIKVYQEQKNEDQLSCETLANPEEVPNLVEKLKKIDYEWPEPADEEEAAEGGPDTEE